MNSDDKVTGQCSRVNGTTPSVMGASYRPVQDILFERPRLQPFVDHASCNAVLDPQVEECPEVGVCDRVEGTRHGLPTSVIVQMRFASPHLFEGQSLKLRAGPDAPPGVPSLAHSRHPGRDGRRARSIVFSRHSLFGCLSPTDRAGSPRFPGQVPSANLDQRLTGFQSCFNLPEQRSQQGLKGGIGRIATTQPDHLQTRRPPRPLGEVLILGPNCGAPVARPGLNALV